MKRRILIAFLVFKVFIGFSQVEATNHKKSKSKLPILAWGDQGDGTYKNPILCGDYSDPDVIRVGNDFYLITSTFHLSPGVSVLHSKDLVNWEIIGHVFDDLSRFDAAYGPERMEEYSHGTWAPAIRYRDGKFWVYVFDPEFGLFMSTATNPAGPWEPSTHVFKCSQYDDCCPFWDDDGKMYLTGARFPLWGTMPEPRKYEMILWELTDDGKNAKNHGTVIYKGNGSEATKIQKINGWYYIFFCEGQDVDNRHERMQMVMRSKNLYGPYEKRRMIQMRSSNERSPAQGALVDAPDGSWWFVHQQGDADYLGRETCLEPVTWIDGWPIVGKVQPDSVGSMVWQWKKPIQGFPIKKSQSSDDFDSDTLKPQWQWNHAPRNNKWSLNERIGYLRLKASTTRGPKGFWGACNTLSQRFMGYEPANAITKIEVDGMADGQVAGLCAFSDNAWMLQIAQEDGKRFIRAVSGYGNKMDAKGPELTTNQVWFKTETDKDVCQFYYSLNGKDFVKIGDPFKVAFMYWRGARFGLFSYNTISDSGYIDVDWFHYDYR